MLGKKKPESINLKDLSLDNALVDIWTYDGKVRHWVTELEVKRIPEEDGVVKLVNEDAGFDQPFPEDENEDNPFSLKEIIENLDSLKQSHKDLLEKYNSELLNKGEKSKSTKKESKSKSGEKKLSNVKDVEHDIKLWTERLRDALYSKNSSFTSTKKGKLHFDFVRMGSTYVPFKADCYTGTLHTPSNIRKGMRRSLDHNKKTFYKANKSMRTLFAILVIAVVCLLGIFAWFNYKMADLIDNNKLAEVTQLCTDGFVDSAEILQDIANNVKEVSDSQRPIRNENDPEGYGG